MAKKYALATFEEIASTVNQSHATVMNGYYKYQQEIDASDKYRELSNDIEKYILRITLQEIKNNDEGIDGVFDKQILSKPIRDVLTDLERLKDSDVSNLHETRIKPFISMLKSRRVHNIKHVAGAMLR